MTKSFRCLPVGNLPYQTEGATTKTMVKLFEKVPFVPTIPLVYPDTNVVTRTLSGIPGVVLQKGKAIFNDKATFLKQKLLVLDLAYTEPIDVNIEPFSVFDPYLAKYYQILERIKPIETVANLFGPFSISQMLKNAEGDQLLADKYYRKVIIQTVCVKAIWLLRKIKKASPATRPIIMLEEPLWYRAGSVKRENDDITRDTLVNMFNKIVSKVHAEGGLVGVQCFEKCDWAIPIDAGVDFISFDAYNNPSNLNIIPDKINEFMSRGGRINWAIVPVMNEATVKGISLDLIESKFIKTIEDLITAGTSERLTYNHSTVSINGNIDKLPLIFAEKALIIASQLSKKIPIKK